MLRPRPVKKVALSVVRLTVDNIIIYQLTETGLALQATIKGTKYWQDGSLN
jgi:hypothetical protein